MGNYAQISLADIIGELGEDTAHTILSVFSCPKNRDVENFLRFKAIEFSKNDFAKTHLVYYIDGNMKKLVGYYAIANKYISAPASRLSSKLRGKMCRYGKYDEECRKYFVSAILIGQLGKNYTDNNNELIRGDELLELAISKVRYIQSQVGGRFVYLECEDKDRLIKFYRRNGFVPFGERELDGDEIDDFSWKCLVQMLKYIK